MKTLLCVVVSANTPSFKTFCDRFEYIREKLQADYDTNVYFYSAGKLSERDPTIAEPQEIFIPDFKWLKNQIKKFPHDKLLIITNDQLAKSVFSTAVVSAFDEDLIQDLLEADYKNMVEISIKNISIEKNDEIHVNVLVKVTSDILASRIVETSKAHEKEWSLYGELRESQTKKLQSHNSSDDNEISYIENGGCEINLAFHKTSRNMPLLPRYLYTEIKVSGQTVLPTLTKLNSADFVTLIETSRYNHNIIILGLNGSGKSSLCNSIATSISSSKYAIFPTLAITSESHVTNCIEFVPLFSINPSVCITLVNTPGYIDADAEYINDWVNGFYDDGTELVKEKTLQYVDKLPSPNNLCVSKYGIIVISWEQNAYKESILNAAAKFEHSNLLLKVVVFTGKDKIRDESSMNNAKDLCKSSGLVDSTDKVFFIKNYFNTNIRDPETDFTSLEILRCLKQAKEDDTLKFNINELATLKIPGLSFFTRNNIDPMDSLLKLMHLAPEKKIAVRYSSAKGKTVKSIPLKDFSFSINTTTNTVVADIKSQCRVISNFLKKPVAICNQSGVLFNDTDSFFSALYEGKASTMIFISDIQGKDSAHGGPQQIENADCEKKHDVIVCYFDVDPETRYEETLSADDFGEIIEKIKKSGSVLLDAFGKETTSIKKATFFGDDKIMRLHVSIPKETKLNVSSSERSGEKSAPDGVLQQTPRQCTVVVQGEENEGIAEETLDFGLCSLDEALDKLCDEGYQIINIDESEMQSNDGVHMAPRGKNCITVKRRYMAFDSSIGEEGEYLKLQQTSSLSEFLAMLLRQGYVFIDSNGSTSESFVGALEKDKGKINVFVYPSNSLEK